MYRITYWANKPLTGHTGECIQHCMFGEFLADRYVTGAFLDYNALLQIAEAQPGFLRWASYDSVDIPVNKVDPLLLIEVDCKSSTSN